jgi:hypothetical protein
LAVSTLADRIADAKDVRIEDELAQRGIALKHQGHELIGPCPMCGGTDRFGVNINKQLFNCRGCSRGGDVIALVQHLDGGTFTEAVATLTGAIRADRGELCQDRRVVSPPADDAVQARKARWLWSRRVPATPDTPITKYLRKRGYTGVIPPTLAYLPPHGEHPPAMIAAFGLAPEVEPGVIIAPTNITGVHFTSLTLAGDKADVENVKRTLGPSVRQPIVLSPPNDLLGLAITEGVEDGLSVYQTTGLGVWVAGTAGRMPALADAIPGYVETVTVYAHADNAGHTNAIRLAEKLTRRGIEVLIEGDGS